jgi:hypothetical protein
MKTNIPIELIAGKLIITGSIDVEGELHIEKEQLRKVIEESVRDMLVGPYTVYLARSPLPTGSGNLINAIKEVRRFTNCGLKQAKDFIVGTQIESSILPGELRMIEAEEFASRLSAWGFEARPIPVKFALMAKRGVQI